MIKIRISPAALEEFQQSECGAWEDAGGPDTGHAYCILQRHAALIEVRDDAEAAQVYYAACSGSFQINDPAYGQRYFRTACRIADRLRDAARRYDPDMVSTWAAPSGH